MSTDQKASVKVIHSIDFLESYNSPFRVLVDKPVNEKYARKLGQDFLKGHGIYGVMLNKLYERNNNLDSEQEDGWVFGTSVHPLLYERLIKVSEDEQDKSR